MAPGSHFFLNDLSALFHPMIAFAEIVKELFRSNRCDCSFLLLYKKKGFELFHCHFLIFLPTKASIFSPPITSPLCEKRHTRVEKH